MNPYYDPFPFYNPYQAMSFFPGSTWETENERDERRFQELYPALARQIQPMVDEECDRMEYDGSFMFDDFPDQMQIQRLSRRIYARLDKTDWEDELAMQQTPGRNWREDFIKVLLLNEMRRRRRRRRDHRRPWR